MKKTITLFLTLAFAIIPTLALAHETTTDDADHEEQDSGYNLTPEGIREQIIETRERALQRKDEIETQTMEPLILQLNASDTDATTTLKERLENRGENNAEHREEIKNKLDELQKQRVENYAHIMFVRIEAAFDRVELLAERAETRADLLEDKEVNVDEARDLLNQAKDSIKNGREALDSAKVQLADIIENGITQEGFEEARTLIKQSVENVKTAHSLVAQAIASLKVAAGQIIEETATTTEATSS